MTPDAAIAIPNRLPPAQPIAPAALLRAVRHQADAPRSFVHRAALAILWLSIASLFVVTFEPAPVDFLWCGLAILLPLIGLARTNAGIMTLAGLWLTMAAGAFIASAFATNTALAVTHSVVSLYLYIAALTFAAFIAVRPFEHARLILGASYAAAVFAALAGIVGYFDLVPGAAALMTKFGRATGLFKDPNVFGPFLVPGIVYAFHLLLVRPVRQWLWPALALTLLLLAELLSFSRGAWFVAGGAVILYALLHFATATKNRERVRLVVLAIAGMMMLGAVLVAVLQNDTIANLLGERASLSQPYDEGPEGRFGGQRKARGLILENPLGLGAMEFATQHHHEDVHNVYLTLFLSAGWIGGIAHIILALATLAFGMRHAFRRTRTQRLFQIAYASLALILLEGLIIDNDHWRQLYLLMAVVWGLMSSDTRILRSARIIADRRPPLLMPVMLIPPSRRNGRMGRALPQTILADIQRGRRVCANERRTPRLIGMRH